MFIVDSIKNATVFSDKYHTHSEAVIVSCFFNPEKSPYRTKVFLQFYETIKHLNHRIIECVIGEAEPEFHFENVEHVSTNSVLWHKEALLNKLISELPEKFKYIFWINADVLFTNNNWLVDGVKALQKSVIIQPFEYCVHLGKDETEPSFDMEDMTRTLVPSALNNMVRRSFCSNVATNSLWMDESYNIHGHVGFAWAARREILEAMPLYDKALIGGADHIIAHAATGQIPHTCITSTFGDDIENVNLWSRRFYNLVQGRVGYVKGNLYHLWHGDFDKREYTKRIQEFTATAKGIVVRDANGLFVSNEGDDEYVRRYFKRREVHEGEEDCSGVDIEDAIILGAAILAADDKDLTAENPVEFGGGSAGGAGAGGSWDAPQSNPAHPFS